MFIDYWLIGIGAILLSGVSFMSGFLFYHHRNFFEREIAKHNRELLVAMMKRHERENRLKEKMQKGDL